MLHRFGQVSGLLLVAPAIVTEDARRDVSKPTVVVCDPEAMMPLTAEEADVMALFTVQNAATVGEMRAFGAIIMAAGDVAFQERIRTDPAAYRFSFDVDALLPVFPRPTLIITGRQDFVVGYRDAWGILEQYPRATFVVFDRAGHMLEQKSAENATAHHRMAGTRHRIRHQKIIMSESVQLYEPINTLKPVADNIWIVDGPIVRMDVPGGSIPFPRA